MGTGTVAIIAHQLGSPELVRLPGRFAPSRAPRLAHATSALAALLVASNPRFRSGDSWANDPEDERTAPDGSIADVEPDDMPGLVGPGGLYVHRCRRTLNIGFAIRWSAFLTEDALGGAARAVADALARELGSRFVLWLPDDGTGAGKACVGGYMAYEGYTLEEIVAWLADNCGPPASSGRDIIQHAKDASYRFSLNENGYLITAVTADT